MWDDVTEVIEYLHQHYCKEIDKKLFVVSYSLGAGWTSMALGKEADKLKDKVTAACCIQPPLCLKTATKNIESAFGG